MTSSPALILGSASPRRRELLLRLGIPFEVHAPRGVDEEAVTGPAEEVATTLARQKAEAVLRDLSSSSTERAERLVVIGSDTVVALPGGPEARVLGKPRDLEHARAMLGELAGKEHSVWTGVAVAQASRPLRVEVERTQVRFKPLRPDDIERYLATGDHEGKAGGYGIQGEGASLVAGFTGCYYNVVGFPLALVSRMIADLVPLYCCDCVAHSLQREAATAFLRRCEPKSCPR